MSASNPLPTCNSLDVTAVKIIPHQLEVANLLSPTWCNFCGKFIWGLHSQVLFYYVFFVIILL